jgi:DNA-binding CsgD family transcriptional regulator
MTLPRGDHARSDVDAVRYLLIRMPPATPSHAALSPREHEIVRMVAEGHPTKVIAGVLNISCWTVTAHLRRIFVKLGVTSRPAMVARLLEEGRSRDVHIQAEKPRFDTNAFVVCPICFRGRSADDEAVPRSRLSAMNRSKCLFAEWLGVAPITILFLIFGAEYVKARAVARPLPAP